MRNIFFFTSIFYSLKNCTYAEHSYTKCNAHINPVVLQAYAETTKDILRQLETNRYYLPPCNPRPVHLHNIFRFLLCGHVVYKPQPDLIVSNFPQLVILYSDPKISIYLR